MNSVCIIGNITRDVEVKYLQSGTAVADATIAVNDRTKRSGEWVEEVSFFDCVLFGRTAEVAAEYAGKGARVGITGKLKQETWADKDTGAKRSKIKIIVDRLDLMGSRGEKPPAQAAQESSADEIPF